LFAGDNHLATRLTDSDGTFRATIRVPETEDGTVEILARFSSDAPGRRSARSERVVIRIRSWATSPWIWYLIPIGLCFLALLVMSRLTPPKARPSRASLTELPRFQPGARRTLRAQYFEVGGIVCARRNDQRIPGAAVELLREDEGSMSVGVDDRGQFESGPLLAGTYTLEVHADGYAPLREEVTIPHRGELSQLTVRLESLRDRALEHYRSVAIRVLPSSDVWPLWTNREVTEQAAVGPSMKEHVRSLGDRVEPIYYGATPPSEEEVAAVQDESDRAKSALAKEREPQGP